MRDISWDSDAWDDYCAWQQAGEWSTVEKINVLLRKCQRHPFTGTGKPEPLKRNLQGYWSRRITHEHRLVYRVTADVVYVLYCREHY